MIACGSCKQLNDESSRVCRFCGTNLLYGKPVSATPPPRAEQRPYAPPPPRPQPPPMPPASPVAPQHYYAPPVAQTAGYRCLHCHSTQQPNLIRKMSQEGLIVLIVMIFFCFPLFWIGLLMKEDLYVCPQCGLKAN